ncbi:S1C family serine protease [Variovorax ureilyticus]|uniref:S1C family serine protease n=1 Tax=Variovorax ureilyticus TaxID=1836198 RepID=UPI003D6707E2
MTADESGKPIASGSAVVIAPELAVTNCHVLTKSASVTIRRETVQYTARRDTSDEARDLCLMTVPGLRAPAVTLGHESSLRPGMRVYAIGSPRRLEQTISDGLLSALRRDPAGELQMVQTSAPISPGSSGGGLFDAHGRLIGITTSGMRDSQNLNFAVPARLVAELARRSNAPAGRAVVIAAPTRAQPETPAVQPPPPCGRHAATHLFQRPQPRPPCRPRQRFRPSRPCRRPIPHLQRRPHAP